MATNNSNKTIPNASGSNSPKKDDNSKQRIIAIAGVIVLALIALNIVLFVGYRNKGAAANKLSTELNEAEELQTQLEEQYTDAMAELKQLEGDNAELNNLIEQQKEELTQQKNRIERLLRDQSTIDEARREIKRLSSKVEQYLAEINQLKAENEELTAKTTMLSDENATLSETLEQEKAVNEELSTAKATLVSEKEQLEQDRERLAKKVDLASVIRIDNIDAHGIKIRNSGKGVQKNKAKNVDQLEVCFNATANEVAEPGVEEFFVRIVNPLGETLAVDDQGSGVLTTSENGDQIRYTQVKEIDYDRSEGKHCLKWSTGQPFPSGNYDVEIYNKGYLAGSTSFVLK